MSNGRVQVQDKIAEFVAHARQGGAFGGTRAMPILRSPADEGPQSRVPRSV